MTIVRPGNTTRIGGDLALRTAMGLLKRVGCTLTLDGNPVVDHLTVPISKSSTATLTIKMP